jgi:hypothetical protein
MAEGESTEADRKKEPREITFRCPSCSKYKPIEGMRIITRFFPTLVVCRQCDKEMR